MKDMNMPTWKLPAKEAAYKIKLLYKTNYNNPEYWLVYAKYAALVNKERHVYGAFQKAFFFKPDYVEGYIAKGTIYTYLAKIQTRQNPLQAVQLVMRMYMSVKRTRSVTIEEKWQRSLMKLHSKIQPWITIERLIFIIKLANWK